MMLSDNLLIMKSERFKYKIPFALILFFSGFISISYAQYESIRNPLSPEDKEMVNRYKIKSMKLYMAGKNGDSMTHFVEYNRYGKIVHTLSDGVFYSYKYDNKGNTISLIDSFRDQETGQFNRDTFLFDYDENSILKHAKLNNDVCVFEYDPSTFTLVERKTDTAWPELIINSYTCNSNKDLIELHVQDPLEHTVTTEKMSYTPDHKMLSDIIVMQSQNDDLDSIISSYTYDSKGHLAEELSVYVRYTEKGKASRSLKRQDYYDTEGRLIEEFVFENGMEKERFVFTYSGKGYEPVSESVFTKGHLKRIDNFELDPKTGLPVTLVEEESGSVVKYRYEFELY